MNRSKSQPSQARAGFTLIEIIAVLVLVGILSAIGYSYIGTGASDADLQTEAERLKSHLRYAQTRAQSDIYPWRVVFTDKQTYEIGPVVIPGPGYTASTVPGTGSTQGTLTDGITTTAGTVIRFDSWGRPMSDAGNLLTTSKTITLTQGEKSLSLRILPNTGLIP